MTIITIIYNNNDDDNDNDKGDYGMLVPLLMTMMMNKP